MTKSDKRNETIRAFRKFARLGLSNERLSPMQAYKRIDVLCPSRRSKLDMLAVYDTLRLLDFWDESASRAVREVYFRAPSRRLTKTELSHLTEDCAAACFCDVRTVYRRLEKARELMEHIREKEGMLGDGTNSINFRNFV